MKAQNYVWKITALMCFVFGLLAYLGFPVVTSASAFVTSFMVLLMMCNLIMDKLVDLEQKIDAVQKDRKE